MPSKAFTVDFLGCKVSLVDAEQIRDALVAAGHVEASGGAVSVVNTCCITSHAEKKSRQRVRQILARTGTERVFVTGCGSSLHAESFTAIDPRVTTLPGSAGSIIGSIVASTDELAGPGCVTGAVHVDSAGQLPRRTRAFVKVQDGCSFTCSYCIVPTVRGTSRSRARDAVLADVARRAARGQREVVLTGINIGLYRDPQTRIGLSSLVADIADVPGIDRVRISSIEPNHVTTRLVEAIAANPRICPHLHVPLQSGDDGVLARMRRNYDSARYLAAIDRARAVLGGDLTVTTDIIVGFPGEDDDAFARTLDVVRRVGFTRVHAFPFSARPGTDAHDATDQVEPAVKRERSATLRALAAQQARSAWEAMIGSVDDVVAEVDPETGTAAGYTRGYHPVRLVGDAPDGDLCRVQFVAVEDDGLVGRILYPDSEDTHE